MASTKRQKRRLFFPLALLLTFALAGCVTLKDPEATQDQSSEVVDVVSPQATVGQTLVSRRARLNGIWLWLTLPPEATEQAGTLLVELYASPRAEVLLASARLSLSEIKRSIPVLFPFPAQPDPPGQSYYLQLSTDQAEVQARGRSGDVYIQGSAFKNNIPVPGDLAFRLNYEYGANAVLEDLVALLQNAWLLIPLGLILFLPGWLILDISGLAERYDAGERAALSLGLSMGIIPLAMTWTSLLHIQWSRTGLLFACGVLSALAFWRRRDRITLGHFSLPSMHSLALVAILLLTLFVRFAMVRDLAAPPWVDSVHHAALTRLILDQGALPESYAPYIQIETASYHSGYHIILAAFLWLSKLPLEQGMLFFGQVINALAALAVYLFTTTLTRDRTAGVMAALIAGLFTPMPAYYTSWGRYTQLTGLLLLPAAITLLLRLLEATENQPCAQKGKQLGKLVIMAGITIAGLILVHYRVAAFVASWLVADLLTRLPGYFRRTVPDVSVEYPARRMISRNLFWLTSAGMMGLLLSLPWLSEALTSLLLPKWSAWSSASTRPDLFSDFTWTYLNTAWGKPAMLLAALGLIITLIRQPRLFFTVIIWVTVLFTLANLGSLGLPGSGFVNNTSVEIMLFMPLALLGGYFLSQPVALFKRYAPASWRASALVTLWLAGTLTAVFAARALLPILNPITFLFRAADRPAMEWIAANIPEHETLLINPFAWGYGLYAGNDGGYWITSLAGRPSMPPPVLYGLDNDPEKIRHINQFSQQVIDRGADPNGLHELMLAENLRYLYIGARGGPLSPQALLDSQLFELQYSQEGTWVFSRR